ncbi:MAG: hypothetical protein ACKO14_14470 [Armatimonadota bacterium]
MQLYFLKVGGQLNGPFTLAQLRTMIASGAVTRQSILVDEYTKREVEAGDIVALFDDAVDVMKHEAAVEDAAAVMATQTPSHDQAYEALRNGDMHASSMAYPLAINFMLSWTQDIRMTDVTGRSVGFVHQKALKLREQIEVFSDESRGRLMYTIQADNILDFSGRYCFRGAMGTDFGCVRRHGLISMWKAHYTIEDPSGRELFTIRESNPWTKVFDSLLSEVPYLGMFTGYLFHPAYDVTDAMGNHVMQLAKQPSFFERSYSIASLGSVSPEDEVRILLGLMMMILLERSRG